MLVSPALRTRETAIIVAAELDISDEFRFEPALYLGSPMSCCRRCGAAPPVRKRC